MVQPWDVFIIRFNWPFIIFAYVSLLALGLLDNTRGPFFPLLSQDLNLSDSRGALFFAVTSFCSFSAAFLSRTWVKRWGSLVCLRVSLLVMGCGFFLIGFANSLLTLLLACVCFGGGLGAVSLAQNMAIQEAAPSAHRRRLFSGLHAMYGFSSWLAPIMAGGLMKMDWDWREAFQIFALSPILVSLSSLVLKKNKTLSDVVEATGNLSKKQKAMAWLLAILCSLYLVGEISLSTRLPLFAVRELNYSPEQGSFFLSWFFLGLFVGRLLFFILPSRRISDEILMLISLLSSGLLYLTGLLWSPWFLVACGFTMAPFYPVAMNYIGFIFREHAALALGYTISMGSLIVVVMHYSFGVISEWFGIRMAMMMGPVALLSIALIGICLRFKRTL